MSDLLSLPDIKTIEPPQENETDMLYDTFNWYEVNDHDITDNFGVDFSTLIKNLEKGDL
ncbi:hypothetical protein [Streptococcus canis]|uniref:hypothetical protein n=1 Tax=Streptococcus canis TaxID=1329 RepID=UPI003B68106B